MTVLVTYASKHGATTEIAEALGRDLCARGVDAEVKRADEVGGVSAYDAVVLGSAIYMGKWLPEAVKLAHLCDGGRTWLFSSGPLGDPPQPDPPATPIEARDHRVFGGRLERGTLSLPERAIVRMVKAQYGDYRDCAAVADYASTIAQSIE
jgi:menaquinone-dependent protoporphyrinogen oxidase